MAAAGMVSGPSKPSPGEGAPLTASQRFTTLEWEKLQRDDLVAGRSVSIILVVIFLVGLLLTAAAILLSY